MQRFLKSRSGFFSKALTLSIAFLFTTSIYAQTFTFGKGSYEVLDEAQSICKLLYYYDESEYIKFPSKVNDPSTGKEYTVTIIGDSSARQLCYAKSIEIPNSVITIEDRAFKGCDLLTTVVLPNSLETIGSDAFSYCTNLSSINFPNSLKSIGSQAFYSTAMTDITIHSSLTYIGDLAFAHYAEGRALDKITIEEGDEVLVCHSSDLFKEFKNISIARNWKYEDVTGAYFGDAPVSVTLGDKITELPEGAFNGFRNLKSIKLPNSIISIGNGAFHYCINLQSIEIPNSVKTIGMAAFRKTAIKEISIPSSVEYIGNYAFSIFNEEKDGEDPINNLIINASNKPLNFECQDIFALVKNLNINRNWEYQDLGKYNRNVETVVLGNNVTDLPSQAFNSFKKIKSIILPNTIKNIGSYAFAHCSSLESFVIPESITCIEECTFWNCTNLEPVSIPNNIKIIDGGAFRNCAKFKNVIIPSTVDSIGRRAFADCPLLEELQFEHSENNLEFNVTAFENSPIKKLALNRDLDLHPDTPELDIYDRYFKNLEDISFGKDLKVIPPYLCFKGFYEDNINNIIDFSNLSLPDGLVTIGICSFSGQPIKSLNIPNTVKQIDDHAFVNCGIEDLKMSTAVEYIGEGSFKNNPFSSLDLPNSLKEIGYEAFEYTNLSEIEIPKSLTALNSRVFYTSSPMKSVTIPSNIKTIHQNSVCADNVIIEDSSESLDVLANELFDKAMQIYMGRNLNMKEENVSIHCFEDMEGLRRLTVGNLVTEIPENLCNLCPILSKVEFGSGLKKIGNCAFKGCALRDIVIPSSVNTIGKDAFLLNNNLKSVTIGHGIESIKEDAFGDDYDIQNLYITNLNPPQIFDNSFADFNIPVSVSPSAINLYKSSSPYWNRFSYQSLVPAEKLEITSTRVNESIEGDGNQIQYNAVVYPENTTLKQIFWESSNPELATVDNNGLVTTKSGKGGSVTITAKTLYADGRVATINLDITSGIEDIYIDSTSHESNFTCNNKVYNMQGICVLSNATEDSLKNLPAGIYIYNGKKIIIK
ncbi:MAG: leucine-rich repeat protein [Prevotella sp.]|nr:leucine-rich repeat protein [Bacteroides sp.]MCM1366369.1 leucine-rich repeat protein [Prevotella sp.]MCM1436273.1 leucine-rich repeat protein [Prevotella sp.]